MFVTNLRQFVDFGIVRMASTREGSIRIGVNMKVAMIGCGIVAQVHAQSIDKLAGHHFVAFADQIKERATAFATTFGGNAYASLEEMIETEAIDVLHICTPHYLHVPMALFALEHGIHVFMEKPPVISKKQLRQLLDRPKEKQLGICFQNRYNSSIQLVRQLISSGQTGKILGARGLVTWSRDKDYYEKSDWRGKWNTEGGGALINQTIHTMDLLVYLVGKPLSVEATISNHHLKNVIEVEDTMEAYIDFGGISGLFYATTAYCVDKVPIIELDCENMSIRIEDLEVTIHHKNGTIERPEVRSEVYLGKHYWGCGHQVCIADFYECLVENKPFSLTPETLEDTIKLMLATYESAKKNTGFTSKENQLDQIRGGVVWLDCIGSQDRIKK